MYFMSQTYICGTDESTEVAKETKIIQGKNNWSQIEHDEILGPRKGQNWGTHDFIDPYLLGKDVSRVMYQLNLHSYLQWVIDYNSSL